MIIIILKIIITKIFKIMIINNYVKDIEDNSDDNDKKMIKIMSIKIIRQQT